MGLDIGTAMDSCRLLSKKWSDSLKIMVIARHGKNIECIAYILEGCWYKPIKKPTGHIYHFG